MQGTACVMPLPCQSFSEFSLRLMIYHSLCTVSLQLAAVRAVRSLPLHMANCFPLSPPFEEEIAVKSKLPGKQNV